MATHTFSHEKQHEVPSISALLNSRQSDHQDYLPTPVTPAGSGYGSFSAQSREATTDTVAAMARPVTSTLPDKPYVCQECHQAFSRPHNLKSHLTTHSSERPFECNVCKHHFRRHHDLKRHQKLHTGERPFVCKVCRRPFARLDALNRHRRAEGGTACSAMRSPTTSPRPAIPPQLQIPHASSRRQSDPTVGSWPPLTPTTTSTTAPRSAHLILPSISSDSRPSLPDAHSWSKHSSDLRALPPSSPLATTPTQTFLDSLESENKSLQLEVARLRSQQPSTDTIQTYKARLHDLQVENKVLRSLIKNDNEHTSSTPHAKQEGTGDPSESVQDAAL